MVFEMTGKARFEIKMLLPAAPDACAICVERLSNILKSRGMDSVHIVENPAEETGQICIHYQTSSISFGEVREIALRAGMEVEKRYGHLILKIVPTHARQARSVENRVKAIHGILDVSVSPAGLIRIEFDRQAIDEQSIKSELVKAGVMVGSSAKSSCQGEGKDSNEEDSHDHGSWFGERTELAFAAICGSLLAVGWLLSYIDLGMPKLSFGLYVAAYFFGGFFTFREAIQDIRNWRFQIELLMVVAAIGTATLGEWAEGAFLLFLFSLGHALEHYAMGRAKKAIEALAELTPQTAMVRRDDKMVQLPIEELQLEDLIVVKPNERIPADGFVLKGESSVNQAPITGESVAVDKRAVQDGKEATANPERLGPEYRVFAGTINGAGALEIQVTKLSTDSTLARVVQMVNEAETQKSPTQNFTDKFERVFVPAIIALSITLLFAWVVIDEPFRDSFYRSMAVLVAASPCALAISTPSAVLSGVARAAKAGVLVKGGGPLENLGSLGVIAFDKTGTLTEGKPRLIDVVPVHGISESQLMQVAIAVEKLSDHPLAAAVVSGGSKYLEGKPELQAHDVKSLTGRGVSAQIDGKQVYIGKEQLFSEVKGPALPEDLRESIENLKAQGRTTMIVRQADSYLGVLGLMDTPREAAKSVIVRLKEIGVSKMLMLSGDNQQVANAVAEQIGLDEAIGDLMPEDKVNAIKKLNLEKGVAMVGDGVNDAPAMASATVGIAMGAAGSDVALETADVALMADDLNNLPFAVGLSRKASRIIRQNLCFSLGMVAFLVPATVMGLQMGAAVLFHEGSTILVVINALRLLRYGSNSVDPVNHNA